MRKPKLMKLVKEITKELNHLTHEQLIEELVKLGKHPLTKFCLELHRNKKESDK